MHSLRIVSAVLISALLGSAAVAREPREPDSLRETSRAQDRLDRELQRASERSQKLDTRTAQDRLRIEADAIKDPAKAAENMAKLEADTAREQQKIAEDQMKAQSDYAEDIAKASESEDDRDGDSGGRSEQMRDLGEAENAEHDKDGFPVRRGEIVALDLSPETLKRMKAMGFRVLETRRIEDIGRDVVRLSAPEGMAALTAREELRKIDPAVVADLVHYYGLNMMAGTRAVRVRKAPQATARPASLTVGMIDTSVSSHPALQSTRLIHWADGNLAKAPVGHGTAVASLLAGEGSATIYAANIFRGAAERPFTSADVIAEALGWMLSRKVGTVNMSLAGPRNAVLDRVIRDAASKGLQVVAAAGNGGPTAPPAYPAALPGVIAVTAVDKDKRIYRYANRGKYIAVAAHGVAVTAARSGGGYARFDGTSFATPHVTAWVARCRSAGADTGTCRSKLQSSARDAGPQGFDEVYGHGVID